MTQKPEPLSETPDVNDAIIWLQEFADESPAESWPERRALVAIAALRELQQRRAAQEATAAAFVLYGGMGDDTAEPRRAAQGEPQGRDLFIAGWRSGYHDGGDHDCRMFAPTAERAWDDYVRQQKVKP